MKDLLSQYRDHLAGKSAVLSKLLQTLGVDKLCPEIIATSIEKGYRSRVKFKIIQSDKGSRCLGTSPVSGELPFEKALWILPEWARGLVPSILEVFRDFGENRPVDGFELRLAHGREQGHISLSVKKSISQDYGDLAQAVMKGIPGITGVSIPSQRAEFGGPFLKHIIAGREILAHYRAFFQANILLTPALVNEVCQCAGKVVYERLIDLYCGVGLYSLVVGSEGGGGIQGADSDPYAIESARKNAGSIRKDPPDYFLSPAENYIEENPLTSKDLVIINPPRQGCSPKMITGLTESHPRFICLISCSLETQIRDMGFLLSSGYRLRSIKAFDMFPMTDFIETVVFLEKI